VNVLPEILSGEADFDEFLLLHEDFIGDIEYNILAEDGGCEVLSVIEKAFTILKKTHTV